MPPDPYASSRSGASSAPPPCARPPSAWPRSAAPGEAADLLACRAQLRDGSRTFLAASRLLPRRVRDPACALYAFCRSADDAVDLDAVDEHAAVRRLRERLDAVYAGRPAALAADRAMTRVVARHAIPRALPEALLDGFEWDAERRRYDSIDALHAYAARVAGSVGAMMALLMGVRAADAVARACDLGVAMQLSNGARDVGEDARRGRLYLPADWLREAGVDPDAWLARPGADPRIGQVVRRLLRDADRLYARARQGIARLPADCRPGIAAAGALYAAIGHEIERRGIDPVVQRAVVPAPRKAALLARALADAGRLRPADGPAAPPLPAVRFLVDAAADAAVAPRRSRIVRPAVDRVAWVIELFERQAARRLGRPGDPIRQ
jgi:phytoene synthase